MADVKRGGRGGVLRDILRDWELYLFLLPALLYFPVM